MKLTDIDLQGIGQFGEAHASFTCNRYHLPTPWEYQYHNGAALLRVRQDGGSMVHIAPPGGPMLLSQERLPTAPAMFVWIGSQGSEPVEAFTNFWMPVLPGVKPGTEPQEFAATFEPEAARYRVKHGDLLVETEIFILAGEVTVVMRVRLTNGSKAARKLTLMPVVKPYLASLALVPWDVPYWYQTSAFVHTKEYDGFWLEMCDPYGNPAKRLRAAVVSDLKPTTFEPSLNGFMGDGRWDSPQAIWEGTLPRRVSEDLPAYGKATAVNACIGQPPVAALARNVELAVGASFQFTIVLGVLPTTTDGKLPPASELTKLARYFDEGVQKQAVGALKQQFDKLFSLRQLHSPDEALNRYVNEFLALQLTNVQNRGWTSMRGVRDTVQDATAIVPVEPMVARRRILEVFATQRSDGWFLRQINMAGKGKAHDARAYVDAGVWVFELVWEYLVYTRDFALLQERTGWLDREDQDTLLTHVIRLFDYYLDPQNIGEHGLCKIREGDWNDSVNAAGLEGRGETVMVTAQAVYTLSLAAKLLRRPEVGQKWAKEIEAHAMRFEKAAAAFKANLLKHALNSDGYFNGVFTDAGQWVFSPKDPDGERRINSTSNTFAVIAGLVEGAARDKVFDAMDELKGPHGWRLFYPALGRTPISKLGRMGQGDLAPGMAENGAPYNHGSHGFLARAAWTAGRGNLLYDAMRYMFPYDQQAHPVQVARTTPFSLVNGYCEAIGMEGVGGAPFNTGSIPVAARNIYDGLLGFRPNLDDLIIDPVIPAAWETSGGEADFLGSRFRLRILNPHHVQCGVNQLLLDGKETGRRFYDPVLQRQVIGIPIASLRPGGDHQITVTLGKSS